MKLFLPFLIVAFGLLSCKKEEDKTTQNVLLLYLLQQQQAAAATASAIAAKPGCKSIIELTGTGVSTAKSLSGKSATSNEIAIKVTLTTSQKVVITGSNFTSFGEAKTNIYSADACTSGNLTKGVVTFSASRISTSRFEISVTTAGSYTLYYDGSVSTGESAYIE